MKEQKYEEQVHVMYRQLLLQCMYSIFSEHVFQHKSIVDKLTRKVKVYM